MPEPLRYLQAASVAALAAFLWRAMIAWLARRRLGSGDRAFAAYDIVGIMLSITAGCVVLGLSPALPPRNALDRLLVVLLPLAAVVELVAVRRCGKVAWQISDSKSQISDVESQISDFGISNLRSEITQSEMPPSELPSTENPQSFLGRLSALSRLFALFRISALLRNALLAAFAIVLLHGSVYLRTSDEGWSWWHIVGICVLLGSGVGGLQWLLGRLAVRTSPATVELSLGMSVQATGLLVMLAGYLKGGAASFALAAPLLGGGLALWTTTRLRSSHQQVGEAKGTKETERASASSELAVIHLGVVVLVGLAVIGRFFGGLSSTTAVFACLAPLSGWLVAWRHAPQPAPSRTRSALLVALQLALVALPLCLLLAQGKAAFDRKMGPLLRSEK